jgi:nucleotide-binding universal stress UspA family protein
MATHGFGTRVIVTPTDFSLEAGAAVAEAAWLAKALGGEVVLLHVSAEALLYGETPFGMDGLEKLYAAQAQWAERELAATAARLGAEGVKASWRRRVGVPHEEIVKVAAEEGAAYIVIGTHGRGGVQRFMLGSVADRVVRAAACPVLTVRAS